MIYEERHPIRSWRPQSLLCNLQTSLLTSLFINVNNKSSSEIFKRLNQVVCPTNPSATNI